MAKLLLLLAAKAVYLILARSFLIGYFTFVKELLIKNVFIWNADLASKEKQDLLVEDGCIKKITTAGLVSNIPEENTYDAFGQVLMPSGVDAQVHLRVPGQSQKETADSGLKAALYGGYGALLTMPNTKPVIDNVSVCEQARSLIVPAEKKWGVKAYLSAAMTLGQKGEETVDFDALAAWGVRAFTDDGVGVENDDLMSKVYAGALSTGLPLLQHAEVPDHGGVLAPGPTQKSLGLKAYDPKQETLMVERDLRLLKKYPKARYHLLHTSCADSLPLIKAAKTEGLLATAEVSPHHLFYSVEDIPLDDPSYKMNPPIRQAEDRRLLRLALADGSIDFVATDHAPHDMEAKRGDLSEAAFGTTGLESSLRVLLTLFKEGDLTAERLVEVFSTKPAKFLGIETEFGTIKEGRPLRAVLVDPFAEPREFKSSELMSHSKNNCFVGRPLAGKIVAAFNDQGTFSF